MKIFVGYGYNERDHWIEKLVFPLIEAFGADVVSGKEVAGQLLGNAVRDLIERSDAMMGFTTRRGDDPDGAMWGTHRWVTDELTDGVHARSAVCRGARGRHYAARGNARGPRLHLI